ncbi:DUF2474 family protein [Vibrio astriarenae]|uniref:DUF2474 family protein n=1 Tax=Vibrio astriarenae TaxID=1481923 RepID=A0A7Z2YDP7_9VIBR|nr:DUF2474 family protein [Vibrio astriarenae]QIA63542.1 DUF2474 family protein [Vibrio astriarenae]
MDDRIKKALWFIAIWSCSVTALFIVSYTIRSILL